MEKGKKNMTDCSFISSEANSKDAKSKGARNFPE